MIRPRIIPTLLLSNGDLVKTFRFSKPQYLGDPINAIRIFNEKGVDELCILDINSSQNKVEPDYELLEKMATEAFMPLSYGGGINNVEQIKRIFRIGFEKVVINTSAVNNLDLIKEASNYFGNQSIVCAIDYKKTLFGYKCFIEDGSRKVNKSPLDLAKEYEEAGAGEILLYSMDRDGMRLGYDLDMIRSISDVTRIPVIACGGARSVSDIKQALSAGANAVAAGSLFVFFGERQAVLINYPEEKEFIENGIYK